jgi:Predicted glycosyltransferases
MSRSHVVSIVTVGMNHLPLLKQYLHSLFVQNRPTVNFELVYVDNCSTDGSVEYIREHYPAVKIIENHKVRGFSENNNIGVKNSSGEYVAIINPDVMVLKGSIDHMCRYLARNPDMGIVVPKLLNPDMTTQHSVRRFINARILLFRLMYRGRDNVNNKIIDQYLLKDFDRDKIQPVDWALGAAMFMSRKLYNELKGFDEDYFLYVEDVDLCLRNWKKGKPVIYYPESAMIHAHQRSSARGIFNKSRRLHLKSMFIFFMKHNIWLKGYSFMNRASI